MKKYKHAKLGITAEWFKKFAMYATEINGSTLHYLDKILVENSNDWEEIKEEPNYLITAFRDAGSETILKINPNGCYSERPDYASNNLEEMLFGEISVEDGSFEIYSVKNSKGEEFTIGDKINASTLKNATIKSFAIIDKTMVVYCDIKTNFLDLEWCSKVKTPIYTTTDGVDIWEGYSVTLYLLNKDLAPCIRNTINVFNFNKQDKEVANRYLTFTSEENRDKYIKEHIRKTLFVSKDDVKIFHGDTYYLCIGKIAEKHIADENLDWSEEDNGIRFYDKEKANEYIKEHTRKPVFVSADGKEMFEGDRIYYLNSKFETYENPCNTVDGDNSYYKYFSTKEARQEYIDNNKPKFSLADIEKAYNETMYIGNSEGFMSKLKKLGK